MKIQTIYNIAAKYHKDQMYGNDLPYMHHLEAVRLLAASLGYNKIIQAACLLHDVLEDTDATKSSLIEEGVPEIVVKIVDMVTDGKEGNRKQRKAVVYDKFFNADPKLAASAAVVKICDRVCNIYSSVAYKKNLVNMYTKEHKEFMENIVKYTTDTRLDDMINSAIDYASYSELI